MPGEVRVAAMVLLKKDGRILLGKRKNALGSGEYGCVGGLFEYAETFEQCIHRELLEETGLTDIGPLHPIHVSHDIFDDHELHYVSHIFEADLLSGEPELLEPHKCEGWGWYVWEDLASDLEATPLGSPLLSLARSGYVPSFAPPSSAALVSHAFSPVDHSFSRISICGVGVDPVSMSDAVHRIDVALKEEGLCRVVTPNGEIALRALRDPVYCSYFSEAELSIPDGFNMVIASRILHGSTGMLPGVVHGSDLSESVMQLAQRDGHKVFLLGAQDGVADIASEVWQARYPGLQIVGTFGNCSAHPDDVDGIVKRIRLSGAHIVLVAFGAPSQEQWIFTYGSLLPEVYVWMGIGGTLDYVAGVVQRAPEWLRRLHLEWLFRLCMQPRRIWRIWNAVVVFPCTVVWRKYFC